MDGPKDFEADLGEVAFDLDFHPSAPVIATSLINGHLHLYRYDVDSGIQRSKDVRAHKKSCRAVRFISNGTVAVTGSVDRSIRAIDAESGSLIARLKDAHDDPVNCLRVVTDTTFSSGDDEGCVKVWDTRQLAACNSFNATEDYISDMIYEPNSMQLLCTSGDGTLSIYDLRRNMVQSRSDSYDDDLLSVVIVKDGRKVVCGSESGQLYLYSWGQCEVSSDRLLGHTSSVQAMLKVDENTLISACEDGVIRLVGILPNRIIQPIAEHSQYAVEALAFSHDKKFLGSISHDQTLKLWDLPYALGNWQSGSNQTVVSNDDDVDDANEEMDVDTVKATKGATGANFFADL